MPKRSNFRQFSLRFRERLLSVSFSGPSWARIVLQFSLGYPEQLLGDLGTRLFITLLNLINALHLLNDFLAPELLKSWSTPVGRWTYALVWKWERRESISIRVIRHPTRVTSGPQRGPQRGQRIQKELTQKRRQRRLSAGTVKIIFTRHNCEVFVCN